MYINFVTHSDLLYTNQVVNAWPNEMEFPKKYGNAF